MRVQTTIAEFLAERERALPEVTADDAVGRAIDIINGSSADCVLVVDASRRLIGIFTERDVVNRVAVPATSPRTMRVADVMTADPEALRPEARIAYAINRMAVGGYRNVPVVDDEGRPVGNLGVRDIIELLRGVFDEIEGEPAHGDWEEWTDIGGG